ncbi:MAG: fibrobacter succinogenes major paralogous domain-containing protein [Bacteroidales bacterium]
MKNLLIMSGIILSFFLIHSCKKSDNNTIKDVDRNVYKTIKIGTLIWMAENLKTTRFNDGTKIPMVKGNDEFKEMRTPAYSWYNNETDNKRIYGGLYNWYSVNTGKLCPAGWHVPSDTEWKTLEISLGMNENNANDLGDRGTDQGARLKNPTGWDPDDKIINPSGFAALPAGLRCDDGSFMEANDGNYLRYHTYFWSSTPREGTAGAMDAYYRSLESRKNTIFRLLSGKYRGHSVRCIKD